MIHRILRICCAVCCCFPLSVYAQSNRLSDIPQQLYQEGSTLFQQKAYAASAAPLEKYLKLSVTADPTVTEAGQRQEAAYMLACIAYELQQTDCIEQLQEFLKQNPDTPHSNRVRALMASARFYQEEYEEALKLFATTDLSLLGRDERDDMTYRMAACYLNTGQLTEAAIWLETLRNTSSRYADDCTYHLSYIRYTQQRNNEALSGFLSLQENDKYRALVPYYIAEIYLLDKQYDKAEIVAQNYLSHYSEQTHEAEMLRILGSVNYHYARYPQAIQYFRDYQQQKTEGKQRRDVLYMLGMSCYHCGVYTQVPTILGGVTLQDDALTQNAYLHMGLAYLQLGDKHKARMAFEQAAAGRADLSVKEQAAYNHALCIHETAYSAFGESVTVFENFLNEFPSSPYADKVSSYLVEVYMNTRSYEAALQSIERIGHPGRAILEAKQKILFQLGTQAFANTQFKQAINYFEQCTAMGTYNASIKADALYWLGESHYRLGQMSDANRYFNAYLTQTHQRGTEMFALAYYNLGYIAFNRKEYNTAEQRFHSFIQLEKENNQTLLADAYNRLGDCAMNVRRFDDAKLHYTKAEGLGTELSDYSYYQLALVAGLQKDYAHKIELLNQLGNRYPQSPYVVNGLYEKGRSYVQNNDSRAAIGTFSELLEKYPDSPVSRKAAAEIGLLHYQNNDYEQAIEAYKSVVTRYPGSEEARLAMRDLKSLYVEANRVDEFAALASQMPNVHFEAGEQDSLTYMAAEKVYMKGDIAVAQSSFNRYLQSYPNGAFNLNAHYYLCVIGKEQKDEEAVLQHAGWLLEYPDSPYSEKALLMHGEILFNRQQYAEAMADYKVLQARAATAERRQLGTVGVLRCAALLNDDTETIHAATALLGEAKLTPELQSEALYFRAKSYLNQKADAQATADLQKLAQDTRTLYGAEAKYLLARQLYDARNYTAAEKEVLEFIDQSTPHAYWLARSFVLLSDVYVAMDKKLDARQYLLSLQQNYQAEDDIAAMIKERLEKLTVEPTAE
ncbi:MAG: tetratricopeptide repeat protein [Bacteroides sp.]|nr:tetratricopeptide repeat protein [Bacteroides sp.]